MKIGPFTFPFYPMRPFHGVPLKATNVEETDFKNYVAQPKLNGDRVILGYKDGKTYVSNRHGSFYKHPVVNTNIFRFANDTLLDGEVYQKVFYPFEVLVWNGDDYTQRGPEWRCPRAKDLCGMLGLPWIFGEPSFQFLKMLRKNLPKWEGYVLKKLGSPYIPLGSDTQESLTWIKRKW